MENSLKPQDFFPFLGKEITFDDNRSLTMPMKNKKGILIGIRLNSVEIRTGNVMTMWYLINSSSVIFHLDKK